MTTLERLKKLAEDAQSEPGIEFNSSLEPTPADEVSVPDQFKHASRPLSAEKIAEYKGMQKLPFPRPTAETEAFDRETQGSGL